MPSAIVTGAGRGIGAACARALADAGYNLTLLDLMAPADLAASLAEMHPGLTVRAAALDITDDDAQAAAFSAAAAAQGGRLDVAILNAGIFESGPFFSSGAGNDDDRSWQRCLDVDLRATLAGVRAAAAVMSRTNNNQNSTGGAIVVTASAGGLYPMPAAPVYAASKGGLVHFIRSAAGGLHKATRIRLTALCPEAVETALYRGAVAGGAPPGSARRVAAAEAAAGKGGRGGGGGRGGPPADGETRPRATPRLAVPVLDPADVAAAALALAHDATAVGTVLMVHASGARLEWTHPRGNLTDAGARFGGGGRDGGDPPSSRHAPAWAAWAAGGVDPAGRTAVVVTVLSPDFAAATALRPAPLLPGSLVRVPRSPFPAWAGLPPGHLLIRRTFAGVNASDVNYSAGRYARAGGGSAPPFEAGFEAVGVVAAVGPPLPETGRFPSPAPPAHAWRVGDAVAELGYGCYSDCGLVRADRALSLGALPPGPAAVALLTSGLTAELGLSVSLAGRPLRRGDTVLVTAAAGGTGQFVVQLAAAAGARVVAVVGSEAKAALVRRLGASEVINHRAAGTAPGGLAAAIRAVAPGGLDVAWESVGGGVFEAAARNLRSPGGRCIVIGMMDSYAVSDWGSKPSSGLALPELLLWRGASATGFFLLHHARRFQGALSKLTRLVAEGKVSVAVDEERFVGLASVPAAVARLQSGRSVGKVVVQVCEGLPPGVAGVGEEEARARL